LTAEFSVPKIDNKKLNPMAANEIPTGITSVLRETRVFKPASEFSKRSQIKISRAISKLYQESIRSPKNSGAKPLRTMLAWFQTLDQKFCNWKDRSRNGSSEQTDVTYNCLDRHLGTSTANKAGLDVGKANPAAPESR